MLYNILYSDENFGDYLIGLGVDHYLKQPASKLYWHAYGNAKQPSKLHRTVQLLTQLRNATAEDTFIISGGLLTTYFERMWHYVLNTKAKVILWGLGSCRHAHLNDQLPEDLCISIGNKAVCGAIRDPYDLARLGVADRQGFFCIGCPTIGLLTSANLNIPVEGTTLLCVSHEHLPPWKQKQLDTVVTEYSAARRMPLHHITHYDATELSYEAAMLYIKTHYADASIVVSARLHGAIIGLCLGKRTFALANDEKISALFSMLGRPDLAVFRTAALRSLLLSDTKPACVREKLIAIDADNKNFAEKVEAML